MSQTFDPELSAVAKALREKGEAVYRGLKIWPAPEHGYTVEDDDESYETLAGALNAVNDRYID